ncbi:hypothetical protein PZ897_02040 [Hoeflea sp. YIM 152468]|uniref:phage tail tape measure protein n=1 Tax=Hoeflea sp. YIM 152468 TaxID=3031759 RepID=UPI0023DA7DF5|nr:phage tail tape measure protein [Hoeflea sp. YIM 152468]MDF1606951.1 hypothetical protein [Hoeflea sp. YIM 152468]
MSSSVIGALRVNLGLDSAQFSDGLKKSQSGIQNFAKNAAVAFAAISAAASGAFLAIRGAAQRADDAWKSSQSLGMPIDELGRLTHAAEMSGASLETLQTGIRRASQAISQTAAGATNEAAKAFHQLGVKVKDSDGKLRSSTSVIEDIADRFSKMPDGVAKTNAAIAIFGRSGAQLIPMLNTGREGLKAMGDEAERLGLVFDEKTARSAEQFNDNIARLSGSMTGLWNRVLAGVIGGFTHLSDRFVAASQAGGQLTSIADGITWAMNALARGISVVFDNLGTLYDLFKVFVAAKIVTFLVSLAGGFISLARAIRVSGLAMVAFTTITRAKITAIALAAAVIAKLTGTFDDMAGWLSSTATDIMNALPESMREGLDSLSAGLAGLGAEIEGVDGQVASSMGTYLRFGEEAAGSFGKVGEAAKSEAQKIKDMQREAARIFEATRTPLEQYQAQIARLNELLAAGKLSQDTYNRAVLQAQDAFKQAEEAGKKTGSVMERIGDRLASTFSSAFQGLIDGSKKVKDVLRDLLSQFASMATNSLFKSLIGGIFGGGTAGGGWLGNLLSFDGGGHTGFGSRTGGLDGKGGFAALLHPNETVIDHTRTTGGGSSSRDVVTIVLQDDSGRMASIADQQIKTASGAIINVAVQKSNSQIIPTVQNAQKRRVL